MNDGTKAPPTEAMMITRFSGDAGRKLLLDISADETVLRGISGLPEFVASCRLEEVESGTVLITQGDPDNDLFLRDITSLYDIIVRRLCR
jgi:hypothetical protein